MSIDATRRRLLYKIAQAYYEDGLTQKQISLRLGISRIKVSRMLRQAKELKVVQINLAPLNDDSANIEQQLERKYKLNECVIVSPFADDAASISRSLALAAADCLSRSVQDGKMVAMSWGHTLLAVVNALHAENLPELRVVQSLGGLSQPDSEINGADLTRRMAQALGARPVMLSSPGLVESQAVCEALTKDPQISKVLTMAARADLALVGIGALGLQSALYQLNILKEDDLQRMRAKGAVGEIGLRFYNERGEAVEDEINQRVVGLELAHYRAVPRVIAVAGGEEKVTAIRAALRGKIINVLVTDQNTALSLLEQPK